MGELKEIWEKIIKIERMFKNEKMDKKREIEKEWEGKRVKFQKMRNQSNFSHHSSSPEPRGWTSWHIQHKFNSCK